MKCTKRFCGKVAFIIDVTNFLQSDHRKSKKSRFNPEFDVKGSAESRRSQDEPFLPADKESLRRLVSGLGRRKNREKLMQLLGQSTITFDSGNQELLVDALSDIQQRDRTSFLTNISMSLAEMQMPCNEDISYFFLNIGNPVTPSSIIESDKRKCLAFPYEDQDETQPKEILYHRSDSDVHAKRRHPVENADFGFQEEHNSTAAKTRNGTYLPPNTSGDISDQTMTLSGLGVGATVEGVQLGQPSSAAGDAIEIDKYL
ncbi:uncharacterized protein LOC117343076 [Pecten maximus]|uniref:uncharacterized protein LOC117343076 n=1 Tax=Pecten maximus TaxID=6579 RepID=UPI001458C773|nr:uncharacterized protein LOC117343076 [Pecten maximus]